METQSAIIFRVRSEWLALPAGSIQEIAADHAIHTLPRRRSGVVQGIVAVRGQLLVCVSLAEALGIEKRAAPAQDDRRARQSRILVSGLTQGNLAFPVEEVGAIHRYNPVDLQPAPSTLARASVMRGVLRWQDKSVGCLDEDLLFTTLGRNLI
jgi:chemotaxis-related protein WspD